MTSNGFDRESVEFQAAVKADLRHIWRDIDLLWNSNSKRRAEIETTRKELGEDISEARKQAAKDIEAIKNRINGAIWSIAVAAVGVIVAVVKTKIGL